MSEVVVTDRSVSLGGLVNTVAAAVASAGRAVGSTFAVAGAIQAVLQGIANSSVVAGRTIPRDPRLARRCRSEPAFPRSAPILRPDKVVEDTPGWRSLRVLCAEVGAVRLEAGPRIREVARY